MIDQDTLDKKTKKQEKEEALAKKLRENLHKRKSQARQRRVKSKDT